jgi:hypothetical protein
MASRTTSSIAVAAPRADVMAVIADFASYPEAEKTIIKTALKGLRDGAEAGRGDGT